MGGHNKTTNKLNVTNTKAMIADSIRFREQLIDPIGRFLIKIIIRDGHWIWKNKNTSFRGANLLNTTAPRFSYSYYVGTVLDNHYIINTCGVEKCVNPEHLKQISIQEKNDEIAKRWENIHTCSRCGTPYETLKNGVRRCNPCYLVGKKKWNREKSKEYYQRTKGRIK